MREMFVAIVGRICHNRLRNHKFGDDEATAGPSLAMCLRPARRTLYCHNPSHKSECL